jgi:ribosomal protein L37AE/L43A
MTKAPTVNKMGTKFIFCNNCRCETEHTCKSESYRDYPNYEGEGAQKTIIIVERIGYRMWTCSGCKTCMLEEYYILDITDNQYKDENMWDLTYYPVRNEFQIKSKEFNELNDKLKNIYQETLAAYNNNLSVLCSLGIRGLLEGICSDKGIEGKNLEQKIDNMVKILPQNIVKNLHNIRFIGNEAAHELSSPDKKELRLAIELCEDLLNFIYELNYKAQTLTEFRGKRTNKLVKRHRN